MLPPSLGALSLPLLGSASPPLPWFSGFSPLLLWPPSPGSLSFRLYASQARPSISVTMPAPPARVTPAPCHFGSPSSRPTSLAVLGRLGNSLRFLEKNNWCEERPSVSPGARPPPSGLGSLPESAGPRQEALRFLASPRRPRIWPPPPANSPNIIPQEESVAAGGRPRLKEAFRAARPGASCPQAQASGRPSGDLRWPEGGCCCGSWGWGPPVRVSGGHWLGRRGQV